MPSQTKKKTGPKTLILAQKIDELHETVIEISEDLERIKPHAWWKRASGNFAQGILRGVGFVFGTTILAAVLLFAIQQALQTEVVQEWIQIQITNVISDTIEETVEDTIGSVILSI